MVLVFLGLERTFVPAAFPQAASCQRATIRSRKVTRPWMKLVCSMLLIGHLISDTFIFPQLRVQSSIRVRRKINMIFDMVIL